MYVFENNHKKMVIKKNLVENSCQWQTHVEVVMLDSVSDTKAIWLVSDVP